MHRTGGLCAGVVKSRQAPQAWRIVMTSSRFRHSVVLVTALFVGLPGIAVAQSARDALLEEIIVTATKRAGGIDVQQAAVAVSAFNETQLDEMHLRDLQQLGFQAPSVQLEDIGTTRGVANFSIRGLGVNSSIPSIDPTVGVFVDGMYLGINTGVVFDMFDMESIEILRGPQGILFGRNVTGGAVLINTTRPGDSLRINARVAGETGENFYASGVISGPITDRVGAKLAVYVNDDGGWHRNLATGNDHGAAETMLVRGALDFEITDSLSTILRLEHGEADGDGPASQNEALFNIDSFDFAIDETGFYDNEWSHAILETTLDVEFGEGQITNITAWREYESETLGDIDATPNFIFHAPATTEQDQFSTELRYAGSFGNTYLTTGLYYFTQDLSYVERRDIPVVPVVLVGGGDQETDTFGLFAQVDIDISDQFTINLGARWTDEEKTANVAALLPQPNGGTNSCSIDGGCTVFEFNDTESWSNFSPKIGFQYKPSPETQIYGFWTKGFRSGGYNMRNTSPVAAPGPFDEEEQDSVELGIKTDLAGGRVRINAAVYHNEIDDLQREINEPDPVVQVVQIIRNTADATIRGFDLEASVALSDSLFLRTSAGYVDGEYDRILFDISGDGQIDETDLALDLPRLAPWSYGAELIFEHELPIGEFQAQVSGYRRDTAAYTDNNAGTLRAIDRIDARIGVTTLDGALTFSAFGRNLKDEVTIGGDTQLPFFPNATFSPLNKGRVYGFEVHYRTP